MATLLSSLSGRRLGHRRSRSEPISIHHTVSHFEKQICEDLDNLHFMNVDDTVSIDWICNALDVATNAYSRVETMQLFSHNESEILECVGKDDLINAKMMEGMVELMDVCTALIELLFHLGISSKKARDSEVNLKNMISLMNKNHHHSICLGCESLQGVVSHAHWISMLVMNVVSFALSNTKKKTRMPRMKKNQDGCGVLSRVESLQRSFAHHVSHSEKLQSGNHGGIGIASFFFVEMQASEMSRQRIESKINQLFRSIVSARVFLLNFLSQHL